MDMRRFNEDVDDVEREDPFAGLLGGTSTSMSSGTSSGRNGGSTRYTGLDSMSNIIGGNGSGTGGSLGRANNVLVSFGSAEDDVYDRQKRDMAYSRSHGGRVVLSGNEPSSADAHLTREMQQSNVSLSSLNGRGSAVAQMQHSLHPDRLWPTSRGNEPLRDRSGAPVAMNAKPLSQGHLETQGKIRNGGDGSVSGLSSMKQKPPCPIHPGARSTQVLARSACSKAPWA